MCEQIDKKEGYGSLQAAAFLEVEQIFIDGHGAFIAGLPGSPRAIFQIRAPHIFKTFFVKEKLIDHRFFFKPLVL